MREILARTICVATVCVVLALSLWFASRHNPATDRAPAADSVSPKSRIVLDPEAERGRIVFAAQECATCHSVRGEGNPRHPLDGIGARHDAVGLREYITGTGEAAARLSSAVVRRKARYQELRDEELAALIKYLSSLPGPGSASASP